MKTIFATIYVGSFYNLISFTAQAWQCAVLISKLLVGEPCMNRFMARITHSNVTLALSSHLSWNEVVSALIHSFFAYLAKIATLNNFFDCSIFSDAIGALAE